MLLAYVYLAAIHLACLFVFLPDSYHFTPVYKLHHMSSYFPLSTEPWIVKVAPKSENIFVARTATKPLNPHVDALLLAQVPILRRLPFRLGEVPSLPEEVDRFD